MTNDLIKINSGWGFSKPGCKNMTIKDDGSFVIEVRHIHDVDKSHDSEKSGVIEKERMDKIKEFAETNIKQNSSRIVYDSTRSIVYTKDDKTIEVENDNYVWNSIMDLVPEFLDKASYSKPS